MFFGFIGKVKGIDILIKAFYLVRDQNKDARLIIARATRSESEKPYLAYLNALGSYFIAKKTVEIYEDLNTGT